MLPSVHPKILRVKWKIDKDRFLSLCGSVFRDFPATMSLSIADVKKKEDSMGSTGPRTTGPLLQPLRFEEIRKLRRKSQRLSRDCGYVCQPLLDSVFWAASKWTWWWLRAPSFWEWVVRTRRWTSFRWVFVENSGVGLKFLEVELNNTPVNQILALFNKAMRKVSNFLRTIQENAVEGTLKEQPKKNNAKKITENRE